MKTQTSTPCFTLLRVVCFLACIGSCFLLSPAACKVQGANRNHKPQTAAAMYAYAPLHSVDSFLSASSTWRRELPDLRYFFLPWLALPLHILETLNVRHDRVLYAETTKRPYTIPLVLSFLLSLKLKAVRMPERLGRSSTYNYGFMTNGAGSATL